MSIARPDALLRKHNLFGWLPADARTALLNASGQLHFAAQEVLWTFGKKAHQALAILEGAVQIEHPEDGAERGIVGAFVWAPNLIGVSDVLHDGDFCCTGVAVNNVTALSLDRGQFEALLEAHPRFAVEAYREIAAHFLQAIASRRQRQSLLPEQILARYLLSFEAAARLSENETPEGAATISLSQTKLGVATGLRREHVNRILGTWATQGLVIVKKKGLELPDPMALQRSVLQDEALSLLARHMVPRPPDEA